MFSQLGTREKSSEFEIDPEMYYYIETLKVGIVGTL
jgi:hypothetical protein